MKIINVYYKLREKILSFYLSYYYKIYHVTHKIRCSNNNPKIIISLTSFTPRLDKLYIAICSIINQSLKPDKIILYLGDDVNEYDLPKSLMKLKKAGIEIKFVDNLKSHKKYYYALQEYPNDIIITVDDDLIYNKRMIEKLYNSYLEYPTCISAMRTHQIIYNEDGTPKSYNQWLKNSSRYDTPSTDLFFTSGAGTLFPPHCFDKNIFDKNLIKDLCFSADDVWLNCMCRLAETKIVNVKLNKSEKKLIRVTGTQKVALKHQNLYDSGNDMCIRNLINRFGIKAFQ